jgi:hypothetical protein
MTAVSFNPLTVSPPAPALRLGEVGGVGSVAMQLGTGVRGLPAFSALESPAHRRRALKRLTVMSNRRDQRWSSLAVARVASNGLGLFSAGCDRHSPFRCMGACRSWPESDEREAGSTLTWADVEGGD